MWLAILAAFYYDNFVLICLLNVLFWHWLNEKSSFVMVCIFTFQNLMMLKFWFDGLYYKPSRVKLYIFALWIFNKIIIKYLISLWLFFCLEKKTCFGMYNFEIQLKNCRVKRNIINNKFRLLITAFFCK